MALLDPIWREEVIDDIDYVESLTKSLHSLVERADYQRAPPELVSRLARIRDLVTQAHDDLKVLLPCFPKEP